MNRVIQLIVVIMVCLFLISMGTNGGNGVVKVPEPEKNYTVTLIDQSDVSMELGKFSCDGMTFFTGKLSRSEVSVDFSRIGSVLFFLKNKNVVAKVSLKDGNVVELLMKNKQPCYGRSSFGDVKIEMLDIKKITMHGKR